jgi:hypothetical protein
LIAEWETYNKIQNVRVKIVIDKNQWKLSKLKRIWRNSETFYMIVGCATQNTLGNFVMKLEEFGKLFSYKNC